MSDAAFLYIFTSFSESISSIENQKLNNQKKLPHCVTPVAEYAKENRYAVASFIGCKEPFK